MTRGRPRATAAAGDPRFCGRGSGPALASAPGMALTVNGSHAARVQDALATSLRDVGRAFGRLSSGRRIVDAVDDAAGLAIADRLSRDRAVLAQSIRNTSDGVSAARIAEGALAQTGQVAGRLAELASQAASGLLMDAQRGTIQEEAAQLRAELDRIGATTSFNGQPLFGDAVTVRTDADGGAASDIDVGGPPLSAASLGLDGIDLGTADGARAALVAVDAAANDVARRRADLGATTARLDALVGDLRTRRDEAAGAEARIRDADVAAESAALARGRILARAGTAVAAQANLQAPAVLRLLR